jgi:hypothetical protein
MLWNDSYYRRRNEGLRVKNVNIARRSSYEKPTWRAVSTSGIWLTGVSTVGSVVGLPSGAPA